MHAAEISLSIRSEARNVALVGCVVRVFCEFLRLSRPVAAQVELAVVEAVNNAIEHGCRGRTDAEIGMGIRVEDDVLLVELRDPGIPIPAIPGPAMPDPLAESGRGWPLIHACMDRIDYRSEGGINVLTLGRNLPGRG